MRKIIASSLAGLTLFGGSVALAAGMSGTASAQGNGAPSAQSPGQPDQGQKQGQHRQHRRGKLIKGVVKTASDTIGIDAKTFVSEVKGHTIAQVAEAHGSSGQAVIDALVAKGNEAIDKAVADGRIDAEKAAALEAKLPAAAERIVNHVFDGSHRPGADGGQPDK